MLTQVNEKRQHEKRPQAGQAGQEAYPTAN
jgi:hypothetical protein